MPPSKNVKKAYDKWVVEGLTTSRERTPLSMKWLFTRAAERAGEGRGGEERRGEEVRPIPTRTKQLEKDHGFMIGKTSGSLAI